MSSCPNAEQLELLAAGMLPDEEAAALRLHLDTCPACNDQYKECRANQAFAVKLRDMLGDRQAQPAPPQGPTDDDSTLPPSISRSIPGYRLLHEIHCGGQGVVYEAFQESTRRRVALKVVLGGQFAGRASRRRFEREVELAAGLNHPNIVTIHDSRITRESCYLVMDLVEGQRLDRYVASRNLTVRQKLELFNKVLAAIQYAHDRDVIHRDLKPSNILVDTAGEPRVLDFGLAKHVTDSADSLDRTQVSFDGHVLGTLAYMSPEHTRGAPADIDARSDVYSLAVVLYELLTKRLPYDLGNSPQHEAVRVICEELPRRPGSLNPQVPGDVDTIVLTALEKAPSRRYQSVREFAEDIDIFLAGGLIRARRHSTTRILRRTLSKHRVRIAVAALALVLAMAGTWSGIRWRDRGLARQHALDLDTARSHLLRVQRDLEAGRLENSLGEAKALARQYPELPEADLVAAQAYFRIGRATGDQRFVDAAMAELKGRAAHGPFRKFCSALQAEMRRITGHPDQADLAAQQPGPDLPDTAETSYLLSFSTLDLHQACRFAEQAVRADPEHVLAWERCAHLCLRTGDADGAVAAAGRLIELGRSPYEWTMFKGHVLTREGRFRDAVEQYNQADLLSPGNTDICRYRALAYLCMKQYDQALQDYTTAVKGLGGSGPWELYRRAALLWIAGRMEDAAADYRTFRDSKAYPTYADARLFLILQNQARLFQKQDRNADAQRARQEADEALAVARHGVSPGTWLAKVFACLAGELPFDELVASAQKAEQVCEGYYYAGEVCLLAGDTAEAADWFRKCVDTDLLFDHDEFPLDPMSEYHLARWRLDTLPLGNTATASSAGR